MSDQNYTTSFTVDQTPEEVYKAVINPRAWWSEAIQGDTDKQGAVFYYHYQEVHHCTIQVTELQPGKKVAWHVLESYMNFVDDQAEWAGTDIVFEISEKDGKTELHFTHVGLVPEQECYGVCYDAWKTYINGSLQRLITTGKGNPNVGEGITDAEKELS
jgi:hypothetical protein